MKHFYLRYTDNASLPATATQFYVPSIFECQVFLIESKLWFTLISANVFSHILHQNGSWKRMKIQFIRIITVLQFFQRCKIEFWYANRLSRPTVCRSARQPHWVYIRGANRNSEIVWIPIRYSDGQQLFFRTISDKHSCLVLFKNVANHF